MLQRAHHLRNGASGISERLRGRYYQGTLDYDLRVDLDPGAGTLESYQNRIWAQRVEGIMEMRVSLRYADESRAVVMNVLKADQQLLRARPK